MDLGCFSKGISVQVTSTNDRDKIQSTLDKFFIHHLDKQFRRVIVLVIGEKKKYHPFDRNGDFPFSIEDDIWDIPRLLREIDSLPYDKLRALSDYLDDQFPAGPAAAALNLPLSTSLGVDSFVGRDAELETLARAIEDHVKPVLISGLGGMGKTELVNHFGRSYKNGNAYCVLFDGSFYRTVIGNMARGIPGLLDGKASEDMIYQTVIERLRLCPPEDILIIDNVDTEDGTLSDLLQDPTYKTLCGLKLHLVLTTRFERPGSIEVGRLGHPQLYQIFENQKAGLSRQQMDALIDAVDSHTMTVDLIARTLKGGWRPVTTEMMLSALKKNTLPGEQYKKINTDYNRSETQQRIYDHLRVVFNVAGVPEDPQTALRCATLLPQGGMDSTCFGLSLPEHVQDALDPLIDRHWLGLSNGLITIHPIIRLVCLEELKPSDENCGDFLNTLRTQFNPKQYDAEKIKQLAEAYANAAHYLQNEKGLWSNLAGVHWGMIGQHRTALECYHQTLEILQSNLPPDDPSFTTIYNNIAASYGILGDARTALDYYLKACALCEKLLPPDHSYLAIVYNSIGTTYTHLGIHSSALEYLKKALGIQEAALPPDDPQLAISYNNIGMAYSSLGDPLKALEYQKKVPEILEKALPADHPDLAQPYNNLGTTYSILGDLQTALYYTQKALDIQSKKLPADHPAFAVTYNNIGNLFQAAGDCDQALEYFLKTLEIQKASLMEDNPILASCHSSIGMLYLSQEDYQKALEHLLKAEDIMQRALMADTLALAMIHRNISMAYYLMDDCPPALAHIQKALTIKETLLSRDEPTLVPFYDLAGTICDEMGDHAAELEYRLKGLAISETQLEPEAPELASIYQNVGMTYGQLGDHQKELEFLLKGLAIRKQVLDGDDPDLISSYHDIGITCIELDDHETALTYLLQALALWEQAMPPDAPEIARCCNHIGVALRYLGNDRKSLEYRLRALEIWEKTLPADHPRLGVCYHNVGQTYRRLEEPRKALKYLLRSLEIQKGNPDRDDSNLAWLHHGIAFVYADLQDFAQAAVHCRTASAILERSLPEDHPDLETVRKNCDYLEKIAAKQE